MIESAVRGEWKLEDLLFNPVPHLYQHGPTGRNLPSVTTLMRENGIGFTGFAPQSALDRGNYTHEASVLIDEGDLDWSQVPIEWLGYSRAYERAMRELHAKPVAAEFRLYHPDFLYAGSGDRVVIRDGKRRGWEIKTGDFTDVSVQCAGYDRMWDFWFPDKPLDGWDCLKLNDDGTYRLIENLDVKLGWRDFVSCLCLSTRRAWPTSKRI